MATPRRPGHRAGVTNPLGAFSRTRKPGFPSRRAPSRLVALRLTASGHLPGNPSRMPARVGAQTRVITHARPRLPRYVTCAYQSTWSWYAVACWKSAKKVSFYHPRLWIGTCYHPRFPVDWHVLSPTRTSCYHPRPYFSKPALARVSERCPQP